MQKEAKYEAPWTRQPRLNMANLTYWLYRNPELAVLRIQGQRSNNSESSRRQSYQRRFVVAMEDVDEVSDGQHACKGNIIRGGTVTQVKCGHLQSYSSRPYPQSTASYCPIVGLLSPHWTPKQKMLFSPEGKKE